MLTVQVDSYALTEEVKRLVVQQVAETLDERFDRHVGKVLQDALAKRILELTDEKLRAETERIFAEGWRKTNGYGEPTGERTTLQSFILAYVSKADSYHNPLDRIFREGFDAALKGELKPLLAEATKKLRAMVDGAIADKLRGTLDEVIRSR